jgi:hypothetical protein
MYQLPLVAVEVDYVNGLLLTHHLFEQHDVNQILVIVIQIAVAVVVVVLVDIEVVGLILLYEMDVDMEHNGYDVEELRDHHYDDENDDENYSQSTYYS